MPLRPKSKELRLLTGAIRTLSVCMTPSPRFAPRHLVTPCVYGAVGVYWGVGRGDGNQRDRACRD